MVQLALCVKDDGSNYISINYFIKKYMGTCCWSDSVLGSGDLVVGKSDKVSPFIIF